MQAFRGHRTVTPDHAVISSRPYPPRLQWQESMGEMAMAERNLLVDVFSGDLGGKPNWKAVVAAPNFVGGIMKATESTAFDTGWFRKNWPIVKSVGGDRYGQTWFRGAY